MKNKFENYEYSNPTELDYVSRNYFPVPEQIILNQDMGDKRVSLFSYFSTYRGMNYKTRFSINDLVKWFGRKPDRHPDAVNDLTIKGLNALRDEGYLSFLGITSHSSVFEAALNIDKITRECKENGFAVIYVDEFENIVECAKSFSKDEYLNVDIVLLVFAYLRLKIYRRRNKPLNQIVDMEEERMKCAEVYDCYYIDIASDLGISERMVSKVVRALNDMGLIYSEALPRTKYDNNKYKTEHTLFCNTYKREDGYLLASGEDYYLTEIENKKKKLKRWGGL